MVETLEQEETLREIYQAAPRGEAPFEGEHEEIDTIGNMNDVARQIRQVRQNEDSIDQLKQQADEAAAFYKMRMDALDLRNNFLKENCGRWLKMNGLKSLATHAGTIGFTKSTKTTWPEDDALLAFANAQDEKDQLVKSKSYPDKKALVQFIESSGKTPEGYSIEKGERISIRKVA